MGRLSYIVWCILMNIRLTNNDISFTGGVGKNIETIVIPLDDLNVGITRCKFRGCFAEQNRGFVFWMVRYDSMKNGAPYVACSSCAMFKLVRHFANNKEMAYKKILGDILSGISGFFFRTGGFEQRLKCIGLKTAGHEVKYLLKLLFQFRPLNIEFISRVRNDVLVFD